MKFCEKVKRFFTGETKPDRCEEHTHHHDKDCHDDKHENHNHKDDKHGKYEHCKGKHCKDECCLVYYYKGDKGERGPKGCKGEQGCEGPRGPRGCKGETGATGNIGPTGATGPEGEMGPTGATGPAGEVGPTGGVIGSILPYSSGNIAVIPHNAPVVESFESTGQSRGSLVASTIGFGNSKTIDMMNLCSNGYSLIGHITVRDIILESMNVHISIPSNHKIISEGKLYVVLYSYDSNSKSLVNTGIELNIDLVPGVIAAGDVISDSISGLSVPIAGNTKLVLGFYIVGDDPSGLVGTLSAGIGYI